MKKNILQKNKGFTLIETMVAVFVLTIALAALLSLTSQNLFSARYANNEITGTYLMQEAIDSIRHDRDTIAFQQNGISGDWDKFLEKYKACFEDRGCYVEPADPLFTPEVCSTDSKLGNIPCPFFMYDERGSNNDYYTYKKSDEAVVSKFKRQILMALNPNNKDEVDIKVNVEWQNGTLVRSGSLYYTLLNWQK
jgi:prepilin-type N-terminal cleavage/methylation domain-containing protein